MVSFGIMPPMSIDGGRTAGMGLPIPSSLPRNYQLSEVARPSGGATYAMTSVQCVEEEIVERYS